MKQKAKGKEEKSIKKNKVKPDRRMLSLNKEISTFPEIHNILNTTNK